MNARAVVLVFSANVLLIALSSCGTPGGPLPPSLDLPKPVTDLQAHRRGDIVTLTWSLPTETTDQTAIRKMGVTRICRVVNQPRMDNCSPATELPSPAEDKNKRNPGKEVRQVITANDTLPTDQQDQKSYAIYAVEVQNSRGRSAGLSNQVWVPLAPVSQPQKISARTSPDAVLVEGTILLGPASIQERFALKRQEKGAAQQVTVSELPRPHSSPAGQAITLEFRDESFEWEKPYEYSLSVVATESLPGGRQAEFESDPTSSVSITPHDVFPPARPTGVQAVYSGVLQGAGNFIDLTWNANSELDLAGYNVYRREERQPAAEKINAELVITPAFRDSSIQKNKRYFYSISAVDVRNNESESSTETSEFVPE